MSPTTINSNSLNTSATTGLINLNKPAVVTSFDCVRRVRNNLGIKKVGHAGTLDPIADGVLVIAVGKATRLIEYVQQQSKTYRGTFRLGWDSDSFDSETPAVRCNNHIKPTRRELAITCASFIGTIEQTPPMYSAIKIKGERAYDIARRGETVQLPSRNVEIYACELVAYAYPEFTIVVHCGSGTYIRSLGRDIAQRLGTSALMTALTRTAIGEFTLDNSTTLASFDSSTPQSQALLSTRLAVVNLPSIKLNTSQAMDLSHGKKIVLPPDFTAAKIAVLNDANDIISIVRREADVYRIEKTL